MTETITTVLAISSAIGLGAISPGPSFLYVARNAMTKSRRHGFATALGTGAGAAVFAILALCGLQALLLAVPSAYMFLKVLGGLYLLWVAFNIYKGSKKPLVMGDAVVSQGHYLATFRDGFLTQISNPKTAVVFASVFTALLPKEIPSQYYYLLPSLCFVIDAGWYSIVAFVLSAERPRNVYLRFRKVLDRSACVVMSLLGLKLIFSSR